MQSARVENTGATQQSSFPTDEKMSTTATSNVLTGQNLVPELPSDRLAEKAYLDKPLPASPPLTAAAPTALHRPTPLGVAAVDIPEQNGIQTQGALISPTPDEAPISAQEEQVIADRTPEQRHQDEDIEMTDNPPSLPLATSDISTSATKNVVMQAAEEGGSAQEASQLPPPPAERPTIQSPPAQAAQGNSKALLPAIRPEHRGRKCLVLDLDETLVHSSFKVVRVHFLR